MLKPKVLQSIFATGILIKLNYINEKRVGVIFTNAGVIGPKFGRKKIKVMNNLINEQKGWLEKPI